MTLSPSRRDTGQTNSTSDDRLLWLFVAGLGIGLAVAIAVYAPVTLRTQGALDIVGPSLRPGSPGYNAANASLGYWASWAVSIAAVAAPGLLLLLNRRYRSLGHGYLFAAVPVGIAVAAIVIGFEISGFTAS
ncbi:MULTISPECIES: hypothetical protein [Gordonia]|jgi:hypothetical protein|uniref:Uncharacterized protein n=1 Tax=Gordonia pseudamarae TaxID=2831662 RepID=A0ABX6IDK9_9ACTN|nr:MULTISPECIES: hypothetical protein [Gordonia]MBD0022104.1 hypothetical protein [Gordonia sp. (in: high G+C Gram-positive bacteria)]QHN33889.1 hypothetical protein GII31_02180 [Gordonia pseudamarae]